MSNTPLSPGPPGGGQALRRGGSRRPALVGAGMLVILAGIVLIAHAAHGGTKPSPSASASMGTTTTSSSGMSGMAPSTPAPAPSSKVMTIRGATLPVMQTSGSTPMPMAMVPLGSADWQGMSIAARTSAPATFILFDQSQQIVRPTKSDSFHLMVLLSDAITGYAIPYSSVWATITKVGTTKPVFDERLWPMVSRYMGPHYGNNVALPSAGLYHLTLLVSPPVAARHIEYKNLWLSPHRVTMTFRWIPKT